MPPSAPSDALVRELEAQRAALAARNVTALRRNRVWLILLFLGILVLLSAGGWIYQAFVGSYAVLEDVKVEPNPASQGRWEISYRVVHPGKVSYQRTSGRIHTEMVDTFHAEQNEVRRSWSWLYEPGKPIKVSLTYRSGLWRTHLTKQILADGRADVVILMDTTESMSRSIAQLKDRCVAFAEALRAQELQSRFALVGFGDRAEGDWLELNPFTTDPAAFRARVESVKRFSGGDLPESALDALAEALDMPLGVDALHRFFLVTDADTHEPTEKGHKLTDLAAKLVEKRVVLQVFTREEFRERYQALAGPTGGKVLLLEDFGQVLAEGRILDD